VSALSFIPTRAEAGSGPAAVVLNVSDRGIAAERRPEFEPKHRQSPRHFRDGDLTEKDPAELGNGDDMSVDRRARIWLADPLDRLDDGAMQGDVVVRRVVMGEMRPA
jgi:hypothetical protein